MSDSDSSAFFRICRLSRECKYHSSTARCTRAMLLHRYDCKKSRNNPRRALNSANSHVRSRRAAEHFYATISKAVFQSATRFLRRHDASQQQFSYAKLSEHFRYENTTPQFRRTDELLQRIFGTGAMK